jgi:hypothetical protein
MVETEPIIIRIQAIDEATEKIRAVASSLNNLQIKMPDLTGGTFKQINVIKSNFTNALSPLKNLEKETSNFQKQLNFMPLEPIENLTKSLSIAGMSENQFTNFLKLNNMEVIKGVGVFDRLTGAVMTQGQAVKLAAINSRRFKMEWLSIMFAGMALERVFGGIVQAQMDLYGITETTADMWTIVMAPAMDLITDKLYGILEGIMNLPPDTQMVIGLTVLGGDILGKVLSGLGQIALAVMGLKMLFPGLAAKVALAGGGITGVFKAIGLAIVGIGAPFFIVVAAIIAVIAGMYLAWKTNFLGMQTTVKNFIDGVKQWFGGIISWFSGILMVLVGIFTGDFEKVKEGFKKIFQGMFDWLVGGFKATFNMIVGIITGALKLVYNVIKALIDGVIWLVNTIGKVSGKKTNIIDFKMPSFKEGGIMPYTGVAYLHAGEKVIPRNEVESSNVTTYSPTIYVTAEVSSDYDVRKLADQLNKYWGRKA